MQKLYKKAVKKVAFTNKSIQETTPTKEEFNKVGYVEYPFDVTKDDNKWRLKLRVMLNGVKYFVLHFTFDGKQDSINLGTFGPMKCKEVQEKINEVADGENHRTKKGKWLINPKNYLENRDKKIIHGFKRIDKTPTIREAIEELFKLHMPRIKTEGSLSKRHMGDIARYLIGYNWRLRHIKFSETKGDGVMLFRTNAIFSRLNKGFIQDKVKPITSWEQLFKRFPPGDTRYLLKKEKHFNPTGSVSLYDDPLSKHLVTDFTQGFMQRYIQKYSAFGTKKNCLVALKYLRNFFVDQGYLGENPGVNPGQFVVIKRPLELVCKSVAYNNHIFTLEECRRIEKACLKFREEYPFCCEIILFIMKTGRRFLECCKIEKSFIKHNEGKIIIPKTISKIRMDQFITITPEVNKILDLLKEQLDRPGFERFNDVPWVFPSIRVLTSQDYSENFMNSYDTRIKVIHNVWLKIKEEANIKKGAIKSFRKTFSTYAKNKLNDQLKAMALTGHLSKEVFEDNYYKNFDNIIMNDAHKVGELYNFDNSSETKFN
jgi:integrase